MDSSADSTKKSGAALIAGTLHGLGVRVIFGLVGIPVVQVAEEAIALGIQFIACRNEQAASYAATAYGYLTGKPGVCLVVGGPGVLHAMAGIGNASANGFPMLLLAGSCETHLLTKGAFQELDAVALLTPHTKTSARATIDSVSQSLLHAYRVACYGRAGASFVDLPADVIQGWGVQQLTPTVPPAPRGGADPDQVTRSVELIKRAKAPLIVVGKGAALARAESTIRALVDHANIPFVPTPMGKGVLQDSHSLNASSARSSALRDADVVLILGARLNWILHFGDSPKWSEDVQFIQADSCVEEIGHNNRSPELGLVGDINIICKQLLAALNNWKYDLNSPYMTSIRLNREKNGANAAKAAKRDTTPMNYHRAFDVIKGTLHRLTPVEDGNIVYVSEGANTMDISRSVFPVEHPRLRMDAGTYATMGVGLGYAMAAHCAYNMHKPERSGTANMRKKIVCFEGDSAFGFSMAEIETMARYRMDVLIFVLNNGGIYHGDCAEANQWFKLQSMTRDGSAKAGLRSTSLGWEVGYEQMATMCGGKGFLVRTPEELEKATEEGFKADVPVVINIIIESGHEKKLEFAWQKIGQKAEAKKSEG
ncbi:MAG: hypothetical protein LQ338_003283 [Usnochroma carphineum]|nr:MAG: hypothetical protein LQ338_003283 [Usnochroma carphineum]